MDWKLLVTTLGLLFVAELGDKTQLAVITMTARTGKPIPVLLGAILGLALVTVVGVAVGGVITRFVPLEWASKGAGVAFITIGALVVLCKFCLRCKGRDAPRRTPAKSQWHSRLKTLPAS